MLLGNESGQTPVARRCLSGSPAILRCLSWTLLIDGETVEEPVTARAAECLLTATPGSVRGIPRRVAATLAIMVTEHRTPLAAICPVVAGPV